MTRESKILLIVGGVMILSLLTVTVYQSWQNMKRQGLLSCISSVAQSISLLEASEINLITKVEPDWKILNDSESNSLMSKIHAGDCGKYGNPPHDIWGNRLEIAVRQSKLDGRIELRLWSKGGDGISGTSDDLVIPYGEKAPSPVVSLSTAGAAADLGRVTYEVLMAETLKRFDEPSAVPANLIIGTSLAISCTR